jgi:hypothetical protein
MLLTDGGPANLRRACAGIAAAALVMLLLGPAAAGSAGRPLPKMVYPVTNYAGVGHDPIIWTVQFKPRTWNDGDDVSVTHARWTSWSATRATAVVHIDIAGSSGTGWVTLTRPGYCRAARAYGFLEETDRGGPWGPKASTTDYVATCQH